jgi:hypothetical protein
MSIQQLSIKARINLDIEVRGAHEKALDAQAAYERTLHELRHFLDPARTVAAMRQLVDQAQDPGELVRAQMSLAAEGGEAAEAARARAQTFVFDALLKFKDTLPPMLTAAQRVIENLRVEAKNGEVAFLFAHGIEDWEATPVTRRLELAAEEVRHLRQGLEEFFAPESRQRLRPVPGCFSHIVEWFRP